MTVAHDYESRIIDNKIAYWKFKESSTPETFQKAFEEFNEMVHSPQVTRLVVCVEMKNAWGMDIQDIWLKTGEIADMAGIKKWGIISPSLIKKYVIRFLVKGGKDGTRKYQYLISDNEEEIKSHINNRNTGCVCRDDNRRRLLGTLSHKKGKRSHS